MEEIGGQLARLTLEEKAALCSGMDFWTLKPQPGLGIPPLTITDGPHGLRKQLAHADRVDFHSAPATCFPTASCSACCWDPELLHAMGVALAEECLEAGVSVLLGPGINIKRSPLCGRNFEYFSEDPLLAGELAASLVEGIQSRGIGASLKHYAVNNQEYRRATIDVRVDPRTLREIYLAGFERVVRRSQPWTIMTAYNRVNGEYCSEHRQLLTDILRDEWGYQGVVLTDWGACNDRVAGLLAGQDLEMPGSGGINDDRIVEAVRSGALDEAILDRVAERLLRLSSRAAGSLRPGFRCDREVHHGLARRIAAESTVLLQNRSAVLPLSATSRVAVLGRFARQPRYQGAGSSQITPWRLESAWDEIRRRGCEWRYAEGYPQDPAAMDEAAIEHACTLAAGADVAVVFAGLPAAWESEALDRVHMALPANQDALIRRVAAANPNTVVVLACGAPVELPWADRVAAIVAAYLGGQAGGPALVDILLGVVNPSGKLAETWPMRLQDTPAFNNFPAGPETVEYREALYVGYRYYDALRDRRSPGGSPLGGSSADEQRPKDPGPDGPPPGVRFAFGHGLSYTRFEYRGLRLSPAQLQAGESLLVEVEIGNCGSVGGAEVVQVYVSDLESAEYRPRKELKGFRKLYLAPGERRRIGIRLDADAFAYYSLDGCGWRVETGDFEIQVGAASDDIRCRATVQVNGQDQDRRERPISGAVAPVYWQPAQPLHFDRDSFLTLWPATESETPQMARPDFHLNSALGELRHNLIGRQLYRAVLKGSLQSGAGGGTDNDTAVLEAMMRRVVEQMPLRQVILFSGGRLDYRLADLLLALMNRRYGRALICAGGWLNPRRWLKGRS